MEIDQEDDYVDLRNPVVRRLLAKASLRWRKDAYSSCKPAKIVKDLKAIAERDHRAALMPAYHSTNVLKGRFDRGLSA